MAKQIYYNNENRQKIMEGVNMLADSVRCTLGPKGRNVLIDRNPNNPKPLLTNDGATIAKHIDLQDPCVNVGVKLIREVSQKTNDMAGDGTTTATVLAQSIINEGTRLIASGANPIELRRGIRGAMQTAVRGIRDMARTVSSREDLLKVATISAEDEALGSLVADAFEAVGADGVITVEESKLMAPELKITRGFTYGRGYISPEMITDPEHQIAEYMNPYILVTDKKIDNHKQLLPILSQVMNEGRALLIVCEDLSGDALALININVMRKLLKVVACKAPAFGEGRKDLLKDLCLVTGAQYISDELGRKLEDVKLTDLGSAASVRVERRSTSIVDGAGDPEEIRKHIAAIRSAVAEMKDGFDKDKEKKRLEKLAGGVAVLKAGAPSELEMNEIKLRLEDAIHACRAALAEGVIAGGGTAYIDLINSVEAFTNTQSGDIRSGAMIIRRALEAPVRQIAANCGAEPSVIVDKVRTAPVGVGYDALNGTIVDMFDAGIVDSVRVTRMALASAASAASVLLTTQAGVVNWTEEFSEE